MTPENFINEALSVPFVSKGRDYSGWDCWGLVYCAYRDVLGIEIARYDNESYDVRQMVTLHKLLDEGKMQPEWRTSSLVKWGNVAVMKRGKTTCHVGLVINKDSLLHTEEKRGTFIDSLIRLPSLGYVLDGIYEHS